MDYVKVGEIKIESNFKLLEIKDLLIHEYMNCHAYAEIVIHAESRRWNLLEHSLSSEPILIYFMKNKRKVLPGRNFRVQQTTGPVLLAEYR